MIEIENVASLRERLGQEVAVSDWMVRYYERASAS